MASFVNEWMVQAYTGQFGDREGVVLLSLDGLSVEETQTLRTEIRKTGAQMRVTKNRLAKVALKEVGIEFDDSGWGGMCALLVGDAESTISAAKAIEDLWKKAPERKVNYRAAMLDGDVMNAEQASKIADMPDKNTLRAMMCGAINGPARSLASLLREVPASTARVLQARADQG